MDWRRIFGGQRLVGDSGRASGSAGPARDQQGAARERFYMRVRESDNLSATLGWTSSCVRGVLLVVDHLHVQAKVCEKQKAGCRA